MDNTGRSYTTEGVLHIRQPEESEFVNTIIDLLVQNGLTRIGEVEYTESCNRESFLDAVKWHLKMGRMQQRVTLRFNRWIENTSDKNLKGAELLYTDYGVRLVVKTTRLVLEFALSKSVIACKVQYHCLACNDIKFSSDYCVKHLLEKEANNGK